MSNRQLLRPASPSTPHPRQERPIRARIARKRPSTLIQTQLRRDSSRRSARSIGISRDYIQALLWLPVGVAGLANQQMRPVPVGTSLLDKELIMKGKAFIGSDGLPDVKLEADSPAGEAEPTCKTCNLPIKNAARIWYHDPLATNHIVTPKAEAPAASEEPLDDPNDLAMECATDLYAYFAEEAR